MTGLFGPTENQTDEDAKGMMDEADHAEMAV